ncbi:hypothetical protein A11A3_16652 [Alcanivorax hongdengensis A-11-3]|uniref:DUF4282 domain-containing protein n=1 Tax=Alcanivorax hongdengensis A-11-3 TaxID=1177179 RepID=L0WAU7_9GAMM|nr:DUF4282 domain-containing protein [Alcanivorax hongdengensis]EKF72845.1 hypothetical protein A11A3_16652 [Alcanivorax hongdengensis A-11-3]
MVENNNDSRNTTPHKPVPEKFSVKIRRAVFWVVQYWRELFNFRFDKYMIIQVIPGVYGMMLVAIVSALTYLCVDAFLDSTLKGLFYTFFAAPLGFLVSASVLRALLEFYMVVFKISEHVDELVGLRDTVDRLSGISDSVDEMVSVTRRIPFWRALSSSARTERKPRTERKEKNTSEID